MNKNIWPTKKLGEICKIRTGKKDVDEGNPEGRYPFFTCSREITYSDTYSFDTEAILIAGNGDVGNTKIYKGKFEAYQRTYVLDGFQENIKYIYYYLIGNLKRILVKSKSGSTMPYIRKGDLENFKIPLPPLPIQQKIVEILDTIQSAVEIQEKIIEKTKELKKSLMAELFKYGAPSFRKGRKLKKTEIGEIPEDWEVVRLGEICEIVYGVQASVSELKEETGRIPILTNKNITDEGTIDLANLNFYPEDLIDSKKHLLKKGDIIFNWRSGSVEHVGKSALFNLEGKFTFASFLLRFRPKPNVTDSYFLNSYLNKTRKEGFLKFFAHQASINQSLNASISSNIPIPLPPFPEQQEIAEILQTIDQKIEIEKKKKELYEELFKTMLNKIMTGEVKVENINF
jgi:type I restriction enzyme S subunit